MKFLLASVCMLILVGVDAHLHRRLDPLPFHGSPFPVSTVWGTPMPQIPNNPPLNGAFWANPNTFPGGINGIPPQGTFNNVGGWPQNWGNQNLWNNGVSTNGFNGGFLGNNVRAMNDPWEHYRRFTSGVDMNQGQINPISSNIVQGNQIPSNTGLFNQSPFPANGNNYPWNSFATHTFNPNGPFVETGLTQGGFVSPQLQQNINPTFGNGQFQNQGLGLTNTFQTQNGVFK